MAPAKSDLVSCTIDGFEVAVPKGTLIIRAAELLGIQVPRFCDHPGLDPVGACRQCIVEVDGQRKPVASCTTPVAEGWAIKTQLTSPVAAKAQAGTMELLLINHPLDCPVCDKGGECPLQNQAVSNGAAESRFTMPKRTYPKPLAISSQVLLDRERCVLCARCTRFSEQVAGDPFIDLFERGTNQQVNIDPDTPFESYFSGNTVQICPVGALTGRSYRFRARPFDTKSADSVCEHCASGCDQRTDHRNGKVTRRLAGDAPEVNGEWNCDKGRWAFAYLRAPQRLTTPLVRDAASGELVPASWPAALEAAARGLGAARKAAVLAGGRLTAEDAHAYARFARVVLGTDDVDFRARAQSAEEAGFLAQHVAGSGLGVTYADLEAAKAVVVVGLEAEEESPILFLRLRRAARKNGTAVHVVAPFATPGTTKVFGRLVRTVPGDEAGLLAQAADGAGPLAEALAADGAVLLVGERLATVPGGLSAAAAAAAASGARLAWVPRRAGERGALDAGLLPGLLPGGRSLHDASARELVARAWGVPAELLPTAVGRPSDEFLADAGPDAYVVGGVDLDDLADPAAARAALRKAAFVVSLELSHSSVTELADVVLPVAATAEKAGSFTDWEGRERPFLQVLSGQSAVHAPQKTDAWVLHALSSELGVGLGPSDAATYRAVARALGAAPAGQRPAAPSSVAPTGAATPAEGQAVLATHRMLLDLGSLQAGEENLAGTARAPRAHLSAATAASIGVAPGADVAISTPSGTVVLPLVVAPVPDGVVWAPMRSTPDAVTAHLAGAGGTVVGIRPASGGAA